MINRFKEITQTFGLEYFGIYPNVYFGKVIDNKDPKGRGRLRVKVFDLYGDEPIYAMPYSDSSNGQIDFHLPDIGDEVAIRCLNGNVLYPVWSSKFTEGKDIHPKLRGIDLSKTTAKYRKGIGYQLNEANNSLKLENETTSVELIDKIIKIGQASDVAVKGNILNNNLELVIDAQIAAMQNQISTNQSLIVFMTVLSAVLQPLASASSTLIANLTANSVELSSNITSLTDLKNNLGSHLQENVKL